MHREIKKDYQNLNKASTMERPILSLRYTTYQLRVLATGINKQTNKLSPDEYSTSIHIVSNRFKIYSFLPSIAPLASLFSLQLLCWYRIKPES
ncbi:hypothetical protein BCR42DRAFT_420016 [Absidia repens]|uniref:Uncharacterized protein n=1 Tax=Absidia repens TaxID=90262 RepID=A0A1X2IAL7_9FUNG|nr:hypothetical protein BCR42DRAFT_420016 [Absidia repens]